ncbi:MAG: hypothetical protein D6770_05305 [Anaerolineae bacterium]|nr:MAG: hypothetical protein D6770_05305 [Anaerolineae bacterium]
MSRIIKTETAGKDRTRLTRAVVAALRELTKQTEPGPEALDLAAFIALALETIAATIDPSVAAWEKRGYWLKADRFRRDWAWSGKMGAAMRQAVLDEDWPRIAILAAQIATRLSNVNVSPNHRMGTPWKGAYRKLKEGQNKG